MSIRQKNIGLLLIIAGIILFFGNLGIFNLGSIFGAIILGAAGLLFSRQYYKNRTNIWALLVATGFFAATTAILNPAMAGTSFLITLALGFVIVYNNHNNQWWAIIPAGILASIAAVAAIDERFTFLQNISEMVFFFGLAATFTYLYLAANKKWAIYPTIFLVAIALLISSFSGSWLLPVMLIISGFYLLKSKGINLTSNATLEADTDE